jgi:hypothetical protein
MKAALLFSLLIPWMLIAGDQLRPLSDAVSAMQKEKNDVDLSELG